MRKMRFHGIWMGWGILLLLAMDLCAVTSVEIERPRLALAAVRAEGEILSILAGVQGASGTPSFEVSLESDFSAHSLPVDSSSDLGSWIFAVHSTILPSVKPDLYDLVLTADGVQDTQRHAVSVLETYPDEFKFVQITDGHQGWDPVQVEHFGAAIRQVNLVHPDFVLITGDIADQAELSWYEEFLGMCEDFTDPIFVINGNHDHYGDSLIYYQTVNPYPDYTFDFGDHHFTAFNTGPDNGFPLYRCRGLMPDQLAWFEADLLAHQGAVMRFAMMHGPVYDILTPNVNGNTEFVTLCVDHDVRMVFAGHTHFDRVHDRYGNEQSGDIQPIEGPILVQTTSVAKQNIFTDDPGYRLIRVRDGDIFTYTVDRNQNGVRDAKNALITEDMTISYLNPDDGTSTSQEVTVDNGHNEFFTDARLLLHMAAGHFYGAENGTVTRQRTGRVDVRIDSIPPLSPYVVSVQASPIPCGDANADTTVSSADGYLVLNHFGSGPEPPLCWAANVDGSSGLTPSDGYLILNYLGSSGVLGCEVCE
jgi:3',5'-cyclic AMP phosphodiesterase CpdA